MEAVIFYVSFEKQ
jgi:hypothetical protein